jgi:hypothetical protein
MMRSARERTSRGSTPSVAAISATRILANNMPTIGRSSERSRDDAASIASASGIGTSDSPAATASIAFKSVLGHDCVGLGERCGHREEVIHVGGVQDDAGWSRTLLEAEAGAQAVTASQRVVEHHHIGPLTAQRGRELRLGRDGAEQAVAGLLVEQLLQSRSQGGVVVDDEHGDRRRVHHPHPGRSRAPGQWVGVPI